MGEKFGLKACPGSEVLLVLLSRYTVQAGANDYLQAPFLAFHCFCIKMSLPEQRFR